MMRAEALSRKPGHAGAIAFSRTGGSLERIRKFGEVAGRSQRALSARLLTSSFSGPDGDLLAAKE
ncbi:hypothetical protein BF49_4555 [Bradyrhizobium sp.]|nr:hypothetical protein BF49_4555 [Bradyrhizobium sp.]